MPRTALDRMSPKKSQERFAKDLRKTIDRHRVDNSPTLEAIGDHIGIHRRTMQAKLKTGGFSVGELSGIASMLRFTDAEILSLLKGGGA